MQYPEAAVYTFTYKDGWPVCFAKVEIWAEMMPGSGRKILVLDRMKTDADGRLWRIERDRRLNPQWNPGWNLPELRVRDEVAGRTATFEVYAWNYTVDWERPAPFADFDGQNFNSPWDFLDYLALRYRFLSNMQPTPIEMTLFRVGSPAKLPYTANMFVKLRVAIEHARLATANLGPNATLDQLADADLGAMAPAQRLVWWLSSAIPIKANTFGKQTPTALAAVYLEMLETMVRNRKSLSLLRILTVIHQVVPALDGHKLVVSETEDWALAGLLIFLAGLVPYGYRFSGFDEPSDPNMYIIRVWMVT
jgi:hypothetical protein